jgi:tetratricopeptide (TPR) repeat protein
MELYRNGVLLCRSGTFNEGASKLREALELLPGHPGIRIAYVRALIDLDCAGEALRHARRPTSATGAAELWRLRAEAAAAAGSLSNKIEAERNAKLEETTARLQARPGDRSLLTYRARLLGALQRDNEAEQVYRRLLVADASDAEAVRELGLLLERANRLDEARSLIDAAVAGGANGISFALLEAFLAWRAREPRKVLEWLAKVEPQEDPGRASQLEVKAQDALGNADAAFAAAEAKNRMAPDREQWRQQAAGLRHHLRKFADAITPDWVASWPRIAAGIHRPPVFLVGFPRSGTTLLDTFLMGHPEVVVLEEIPLMGFVAEQVGSLDRIPDLDKAAVERLREMYFCQLARDAPDGFSGLVIDKMPLNMTCAPLIHRLFPKAPIVFAQRHPCDCVLSGFFQSFNMNPAMASFLDLHDAADLYDVAMQIWTRSVAVLPMKTHTIIYEQMVERPGQELRSLIGFLGLDWNESMIEHRRTAKARGAIPTASYDQVTEPLNRNSVERWRRYATQLAPLFPILLPWAERLGYGR